MFLFELFRLSRYVPPARRPLRTLGVESLENRSVLTAGVLAPAAVELIGPVTADAAPDPAVIGPQDASAAAAVSPLEAQAPVVDQAAAELALQELTAEGEGEVDGGIPRITSLYAVELFGWVWFEGTVEDDDSPSNVTVYFSGVYGDFSVSVEPDGSFWSTPFMAYGGEVTAYAEDFYLNRSEIKTIFA
jgi:hypothetical protein